MTHASNSPWRCATCDQPTEERPCECCGSFDVEAVLADGSTCDVLDLDPRCFEVVVS
jgi:hypothetical protein